MLTILVRIFFGSKTLYYSMAPSFLQSPFDLFAFHKAQFMIGCLVLAILFNVLTIVRSGCKEVRRDWRLRCLTGDIG